MFLGAALALIFSLFTVLPIAVVLGSPLLLVISFIQGPWFNEYKAKRYTRSLYKKALQVADVPPPPPVCNSIQGARYRDSLLKIMSGEVEPDPVPIDKYRFEHVHMVAQIGHGKTQSLQFFISRDLEHLGDRTVIVIDSQGEMIRNLLKVDIPKEQIVYINPRDRKYPPALNLFSETPDTQNINATIEIYEYILGGIFGAELTAKQGVAFRFVIRLMLTIPYASIDTLLEVFQDHTQFQEYIDKLSGPARNFFDNEFGTNQYRDTKQQVIRRIFTIMENDTLYAMFSSRQSRLDVGKEMDSGKLILIDTAKDQLKEEGARILGRFFIAKIVQAAQERGSYKFPVHVYVDEVQDYVDDRVEVFLSQLRKQKVGGFFAHQYLGQLPQKLQDAFMANTATKMVGGVSMKDARAFAPDMKVTPDELTKLPKGTFATLCRGMPQGIAVSIPFFELENWPKRSDMDELIEYQREQYARPPKRKALPFYPEQPSEGPKRPQKPRISGFLTKRPSVQERAEKAKQRRKEQSDTKSYDL